MGIRRLLNITEVNIAQAFHDKPTLQQASGPTGIAGLKKPTHATRPQAY
jgi:hypothetical protein